MGALTIIHKYTNFAWFSSKTSDFLDWFWLTICDCCSHRSSSLGMWEEGRYTGLVGSAHLLVVFILRMCSFRNNSLGMTRLKMGQAAGGGHSDQAVYFLLSSVIEREFGWTKQEVWSIYVSHSLPLKKLSLPACHCNHWAHYCTCALSYNLSTQDSPVCTNY